MSVEKMLEIARGEVGYLEKRSNAYLDDKTTNAGSNNYNKYARDIWPSLQAQPWCELFVSWCGIKAGEQDAVGKFSYVPSHIQFFRNRGQYFSRGAKTPQAGDIIFFGDEAHVGMVEYVSGGYVHTIEGNTSGGSTLVANGGGVHQKTYPLTSSYIMGYGRPAYSSGYKLGWNKAENGRWWYAYSSAAYYKDQWAKIGDDWFVFDKNGYALYDTVVEYSGKKYQIDHDGIATEIKEQPAPQETKQEDDEDMLSYEQFKEYMNQYNKELENADGSSWSEEARAWATQTGLIVGGDKKADGTPKYMWKSAMSREALCQVLKRFADQFGK